MTTLVLIPKVQQIFEIKNQIDSQNTEIKKLSSKLVDLQTLSETELYDSSKLLLLAMPQEKDFFQVLSSVKKTLNDTQITMDSFGVSPGLISTESSDLRQNDVLSKGASSMQVKVSFFASPDNLGGLVGGLEKSLPLLEISSIKLTSLTGSASADLQVFGGEMVLNTYSSLLPKTIGKLDSPLPKMSAADQKLIEDLKSFNSPPAEVSTETSLQPVVLGKDNPFPFRSS